jgi:hypothetical protein
LNYGKVENTSLYFQIGMANHITLLAPLDGGQDLQKEWDLDLFDSTI